MTNKSLKIAFIGCGKIGEALLNGLLSSKFAQVKDITATTKHSDTAIILGNKFGIIAHNDNAKAVKGADVVIVAAKPNQIKDICAQIKKVFPKKALLISLATGVPTKLIQTFMGSQVSVIRAMPNTPITIGEGMTVVCKGSYASDKQMDFVKDIFSRVGHVASVDEELMNASTGMSASGPAYVYMIIESLAEAGVKVGLSRDLATHLAAQTVLGASRLVLETGKHPALLKDMVTTPAGVTIDGLMELEEGGMRVALIKAIMMSTRRAEEIENKLIATTKISGIKNKG